MTRMVSPTSALQHWAEHAEMPIRRARFQFGESFIGVFAIYRFTIGRADAVRAALGENFG
jgi:hypothetical protein